MERQPVLKLFITSKDRTACLCTIKPIVLHPQALRLKKKRPRSFNVKRPNRFIWPQAGLCGLAELGLAGREKDLSPGKQGFYFSERPTST